MYAVWLCYVSVVQQFGVEYVKKTNTLTTDQNSWLVGNDSLSSKRDDVGNVKAFKYSFLPKECSESTGILVGHGKQTCERCGTYNGLVFCPNVDLHNLITLEGVSYSGKVFYRKKFYHCHNPLCPVCFPNWNIREAGNVVKRLTVAAKNHGVIEHVICSPPAADYDLNIKSLRAKCIKVLASRGIKGGALIYHSLRYHRANETYDGEPAHWFFAPHFHCLGFVEDGYGKCRGCKKSKLDCLSCSGWEGRTRRLYLKEGKRNGSGVGWIVKVKAKRKTVMGTAWYALSHCTVIKGAERNTVVTYFGVCSYRKLKLEKGEKTHEDICPLCGHPLEEGVYVGKGEILKEWWLTEAWTDFLDEEGNPRFIIKPKRGSGRYEG